MGGIVKYLMVVARVWLGIGALWNGAGAISNQPGWGLALSAIGVALVATGIVAFVRLLPARRAAEGEPLEAAGPVAQSVTV